MSNNTSPFYPSGLLDPRSSADLKQLLWQNFLTINEGPGFSRQPSRVGGLQTDHLGPPTSGQQWANALWVDGLHSLWLCTISGTPGTWVQVEPPIVSSPPITTLVGYRIIRFDLAFAQYYWDGSVWVEISGGGGGGSSITLANLIDPGGLGVYDHTALSVAYFRLIKGGSNIDLTSGARSITVAVSDSPTFTGMTSVSTLRLIPQSTPSTPPDDSIVAWVESTGASPNKLIIAKMKARDVSEVILSSVIV